MLRIEEAYMAEIKPFASSAEYKDAGLIQLSTGELRNESESIEASDERIYTELLSMTTQYDTYSSRYMGDSSTMFVEAMQTFYGKAAKLSSIQKNCAGSLLELAFSSAEINEDAFLNAYPGGKTK